MEQFDWVCDRLLLQGLSCDKLDSFRELRLKQVAALRGDAFDFQGVWTGRDQTQMGFVFHMHVRVQAEQEGELNPLWRGEPEDQPLWTPYHRLGEGDLQLLALKPSDQRGWYWNNGRHGRICFHVSQARQARGIDAAGDERSVSGYIHYTHHRESHPPPHLRDVQGLPLKVRALEFVSGTYSPSQRRLLLAGTHMNDAGHGMLGLDQYDMTLSEDGFRVTGISRGVEVARLGSWTNELDAMSSACLLPDNQ